MQKDKARVHLLPIREARPSAGPLMASWMCVQICFHSMSAHSDRVRHAAASAMGVLMS